MYSPFIEEGRYPSRKKNTHRWCKGKVGREHDWELGIPWGKVKGWTWMTSGPYVRNFKVDVCRACKKQRWHQS